jgi:uncharacterized protein (DUF305 family)
MRRSVPIPILVLALLLTALVTPVAASGPASDRATQQFEIRFMEKTIEHHLMGVAMGEMCLEKATAPPPASDQTLVELCSQIIAEQSAQAELLMGWLNEWYGVDFEPKLSGGMMNRLERASGEEFDIMVSEMFIDHHLRQIRTASFCRCASK